MDYFLARWYIVKDLPPARLRALHSFERAVHAYGRRAGPARRRAKIVPPLWWQEGALFLRGEFKKFWALGLTRDIHSLAGFKEELARVFSGAALSPGGRGIFSDIDLAHRCDLAINASNAQNAPHNNKQPNPARAA